MSKEELEQFLLSKPTNTELTEKLIELVNKFEWNDLTKNPDSLPKHNNQILVAFAFNENTNQFYCFDVANYFDGAKKFITNTSDGDNVNNGKKVIAWKEIE